MAKLAHQDKELFWYRTEISTKKQVRESLKLTFCPCQNNALLDFLGFFLQTQFFLTGGLITSMLSIWFESVGFC